MQPESVNSFFWAHQWRAGRLRHIPETDVHVVRDALNSADPDAAAPRTVTSRSCRVLATPADVPTSMVAVYFVTYAICTSPYAGTPPGTNFASSTDQAIVGGVAARLATSTADPDYRGRDLVLRHRPP